MINPLSHTGSVFLCMHVADSKSPCELGAQLASQAQSWCQFLQEMVITSYCLLHQQLPEKNGCCVRLSHEFSLPACQNKSFWNRAMDNIDVCALVLLRLQIWIQVGHSRGGSPRPCPAGPSELSVKRIAH